MHEGKTPRHSRAVHRCSTIYVVMRNPSRANFVPNIASQVIHTLTHWSSGEWKPPTGRAGYFSEDNYGDTEVFRDGKMRKDKRLTRILDVINDLSDDEWDAIINAVMRLLGPLCAEPISLRPSEDDEHRGVVGNV